MFRSKGCYDNLNGGFAHDALVDFTGGISEFVDIKPKRQNPGHLFDKLYAMVQKYSLICTHIDVRFSIWMNQKRNFYVMCVFLCLSYFEILVTFDIFACIVGLIIYIRHFIFCAYLSHKQRNAVVMVDNMLQRVAGSNLNPIIVAWQLLSSCLIAP